MRLTVIGTGYVGLVTGSCFAESGNDVTCVDIDADKVARMSAGICPIYEPGLENLMQRNLAAGRLRFTTEGKSAVEGAELVFLAVGTPPGPDGHADLSQVLAAARTVAAGMNEYKTVAIKSTVPVGTSDRVKEAIREGTDVEFDMVSNPEFLKEGAAVDDCLKPDRIVVGAASERARKRMAELYAPFVRTQNPVLFMDIRSAELTKYAANAMLALRISFMNELSGLATRVGADITAVRRGIGSDHRIGRHFLFPGVGYGGSCFPKDVKALIRTGEECGTPLHIMEAAEAVNQRQKSVLFEMMKGHFGDLTGRRVALWGLAFKPNTDDMREAPAIPLIEALLSAGAEVSAFDPAAGEAARELFGDRIRVMSNNHDVLHEADCLAVITEWNAFRMPDLDRIRKELSSPVIFDGRNIYSPEKMREMGFTYYCIGRAPVLSEAALPVADSDSSGRI